MPSEIETVRTLLSNATDRLHREEEKEDPDIRNVLFSLSSLITSSIGIAVAIEDLYKKLFDLEKSHDGRLRDLSKKIIYLSATVSIAGGVIVLLGKYIMGMLFK